ncbi:MAG TPA: DUF885 domain-containing protein [Myxococcales bacterium]|nr:DUF885 domain-containing protein [Myxococcales bacterium]
MILLCALLAAAAVSPENAKFEALAQRYIEGLLARAPEMATRLGDHRNDARLNDYTQAGVRKELEADKAALRELSRIDAKALSPEDSVDLRILRNRLEAQVYALETLREWQWNPLRYNPGEAIYALVAREFAPAEQRLRSAIGRLGAVPAVVAAAKANLQNPPRVHTETAIQQNKGTLNLVRTQLEPLVKAAPALEPQFRAAQAKAVASLQEYQQWLEKDLLPRSQGDFRLGEEKFRRKLRLALDSDLSPEEILRRAEADLKTTQAAMQKVALAIWAKNFAGKPALKDSPALIKAVLDDAARRHPDNQTVIARATEDLARATDFVRMGGFVTVLAGSLEVQPWPEFSRGVAVASCSAPGPLEKGQKTFYYISPTPSDWTPERVQSFFREYDDDMLQEVTVHEAMPGHFLQLAHGNRFRAPTLVRAIFRSGTFIEGWATYAEQVMADAGYGGPEVHLQQLKMRLRFILNAILDQKIHAGGMTEKDAVALMTSEGFQEEGEAVGKWKRAQLTSTQLSTYYVGNLELNDLRAAWQKKHGNYPTLRAFHDAVLSHGAPPPRYVREQMGL